MTTQSIEMKESNIFSRVREINQQKRASESLKGASEIDRPGHEGCWNIVTMTLSNLVYDMINLKTANDPIQYVYVSLINLKLLNDQS